MKTFYKVTINQKLSDNFDQDFIILIRDCFTKKSANEIAEDYANRCDKHFGGKTFNIEIVKKSYKRVPKKFMCI